MSSSGGGCAALDVADPESAETKAKNTIACESKNEASSKLQSVNRLLRQLPNPCETKKASSRGTDGPLLATTSSGTAGPASNGSERDDDEALASDSSSAGIFVVANRDLPEGTMVLACPSEGMVLETPEHRSQYCTHCGRNTTDLTFDPDCLDLDGTPMMGYCSDCLSYRDQPWRKMESGVLRCLRNSLAPEPDDQAPDAELALTHRCIRHVFGSSVALLAVRILSRRYASSAVEEGGAAESSWWHEFCLLYEHRLPPSSPYHAVATLLAAAFGAVGAPNDEWEAPTHDVVVATLGRVLGCSHAVVDPSRPLGQQAIGRAVFAGQSFYNHSCAPNAYLSTTIPEEKVASPPLARVHLLRPVQTGEQITLSYLPLSGLSTEERQDALSANYGFHCTCPACDTNNSNASLVLPQTAGVREGIEAIREVQFGLNDRLLELSNQVVVVTDPASAAAEEEQSLPASMRDELMGILGRVRMTQRGIRNQGLPACHEVGIESHRLAAMACDVWLVAKTAARADHGGNNDDENAREIIRVAEQSHRAFFDRVATISTLFDPLAWGTQVLEAHASRNRRRRFGLDAPGFREHPTPGSEHKNAVADETSTHESPPPTIPTLRRGLDVLATCLGRDHPWVQRLMAETDGTEPGHRRTICDSESPAPSSTPKDAKRRRLECRTG